MLTKQMPVPGLSLPGILCKSLSRQLAGLVVHKKVNISSGNLIPHFKGITISHCYVGVELMMSQCHDHNVLTSKNYCDNKIEWLDMSQCHDYNKNSNGIWMVRDCEELRLAAHE